MGTEFSVTNGGVTLAGEEAGEGPAVVLLHGLTATRRYVVMGSHALERSGQRVIAYDARAHGHSSPAPAPDGYHYADLAEDLGCVLDQLEVERAVLAGASMGAHTLLRFALQAPERVAGLVVITPAYDGQASITDERMAKWDRLAAGLRAGGVEGFVQAYGEPDVCTAKLAVTVQTVIRQRLAKHDHPDALADALQSVPRSRPFDRVEDLSAISVPTAIVGSNDGADPEHPFAVAELYAQTIPGARLISDPPGASPIAWQGSQLSKIIADVVSASR